MKRQDLIVSTRKFAPCVGGIMIKGKLTFLYADGSWDYGGTSCAPSFWLRMWKQYVFEEFETKHRLIRCGIYKNKSVDGNFTCRETSGCPRSCWSWDFEFRCWIASWLRNIKIFFGIKDYVDLFGEDDADSTPKIKSIN